MRSIISTDPIAALATPPGRSGVAIIRISGENVWQKIIPLLKKPNNDPISPTPPTPRLLQRIDLIDANNQPLDQALVVFFKAPNSFTGEDQIEIQGHGSPVVIARIMERLTELGIRPANPGEFSRRAFLNGKTDLAQAEALMNLINASSLRAAREAAKQMDGTLSQRLINNKTLLLEALAHLEATLDFADEDISPDDQQAIVSRLTKAAEDLGKLLQGSILGRQLAQGFELAIIGRPNVGKSTLFNRLIGQNRAIVTPQPGTTRDILESPIEIHGIPVQLTDTAGLRDTNEVIEEEGIKRAKERLKSADAVLLLLDISQEITTEDQEIIKLAPLERTIIVWNKQDLSKLNTTPDLKKLGINQPVTTVVISCKKDKGINQLTEKIANYFGSQPIDGEGSVVMVARQKESLQKTISHLCHAEAILLHQENEELVAISIREALNSLGELIGETTQDDLLDLIFSSFCIGK
ncbi:MAG: tRNA uridine-5-carboxymethylaminomethyl(34) synthesis GTPase MnmE [Magnetococcales bacterium]|nr:tRNA uridine-5-carboxymethylaminomethyl(34) synthesis GTPase MnmE [Magnetococcales bacterium]